MGEDTYLVTKYAERERVKALGARWDPERRSWYVPAGRDLTPFSPWLPAESTSRTSALKLVEAQAAEMALPARSGVTLSQLLSGVATAVAEAYAVGVWTMVEVVDTRLRGGHVYLEVSERSTGGEVTAKSTAIIWASTANRILPAFEQATGVKIGPGIKLLLRLRPVFKPQYGFSLEVDAIDHEYTLGDLEAKKREIRSRLQREGLFDANRSISAPWDYNAVLVLAPQGAAGLGDFKAEADLLEHAGICRFSYIFSRFQGEGAASEIRVALVDALQGWFHREGIYPDAVAIIRGGGAVNDLAWLNDYELARCICEVPVPVLTGIGHERDSTLPDEVAHTKFDTPSKVIHGIEQAIHQRTRAAASFFRDVARLGAQATQASHTAVERLEGIIRSGARRQLSVAAQSVEVHAASVRVGAHRSVRSASEAAVDAHATVHQAARRQVGDAKIMLPALLAEVQGEAKSAVRSAQIGANATLQRIVESAGAGALQLRETADRSMAAVAADARRVVRDATANSTALAREVVGQGPEKTLSKGFAMVRTPEGKTVTSASQAEPSQQLQLHFRDGIVPAQVPQSGDKL